MYLPSPSPEFGGDVAGEQMGVASGDEDLGILVVEELVEKIIEGQFLTFDPGILLWWDELNFVDDEELGLSIMGSSAIEIILELVQISISRIFFPVQFYSDDVVVIYPMVFKVIYKKVEQQIGLS